MALMPLCAYSQKKEISQAKALVKAGNELPKAEEMMRTLLKDSANRGNEKIWLVLMEAVKKQYEKGNEQLYLKNKYDTAQLFTAARNMLLVAESFDSIDAMPNGKGQVQLKYRKKHAEYLNAYRPNVYNGGLFFLKKRDYAKAFDCFDTYIDCQNQPLFAAFDYANTDTLLPRAAYMAAYCGFKMGDHAKTLRHQALALKDTPMLDNLYQYMAMTYEAMGDTAQYKSCLDKGFAMYPKTMYYFSHLFDWHYKRGDMQQSLQLCNTALQADSTNSVVWFAKSTVLLNIERYDECIGICDKLIARNDSLADAYLNAGLAYYNQAAKLSSDNIVARKHKKQLQSLYKSAMPYMQRYRQLMPANKDKWAMPLYAIYLNLNMGKEFDEMDAIIKQEQNGNK